MKVRITAVVEVPEATASVLESWVKTYFAGLTGQIDGLAVESVTARPEGASEQATYGGRRRSGAEPKQGSTG